MKKKTILETNKKAISNINDLLIGLPKFDKDSFVKLLQKIGTTSLKIKSSTNKIMNLKKELGESSGEKT